MSIRPSITRLLSRHGINARQMKTLLAVYLKQDLRSGKAFMQSSRSEYLTSNWSLLVIIAAYLMMGLTVGILVFTGMHVFFYSVFALSFTFVIVALAVVTESSNVIFNEAEVDVIGHLPVSSRTLFASKLLNLFLFTLLLAAAANLFPTLFGIWAAHSGWGFSLAHAVSALLISLFGTALVVTSYGLLMRYVSKERFDNIVAYCQAALAVFFMFGYQVLPRIFDFDQMPTTVEFRWYYLLLPPAWFSGVTMLLMGEPDAFSILLSMLATLSLLILGALALRKVGRGYSSFLSELAYGEGKAKAEDRPSISETDLGRGHTFLQRVKSAILRRPVERAVFDLVLTYLKRNREIKIRLYPSLAYFLIFPLIAIVSEGLRDPFINRASSFYVFMGTAMICFVALTAIEGLLFSEHYQAAYIFRVTPIISLGDVHGGIRKAILCFVIIPGFVILILFYSIFWRNPLHALLVIAPWAAITPVVLKLPFIRREVLPLSRKYQKGQQSARNTALFIVSSIGMTFIGLLQFMALRNYSSYWIFIACVTIASTLLYLALGKLSGESRPIVTSELPLS